MTPSLRQGIAMALLPLIRALPAGKRFLYNLVPLDDATVSRMQPRTRVFYDRDIGAWAFADLDWSFSRRYFFYGRYPLDSLPLLIAQWLRPGDVFVDIGAHWGIYTLAGCRAVGPRGTVIAIEPNPASASIVEAHVTINGIRHCRLHRVGLSAEPGELSLAMPSNTDSSWYTFRPLENTAQSVKVPVVRAETLLRELPVDANILVKIDTEGFEHQVLRGFGEILDRPRIAFVLEITDAWLRDTGSSAAELFDDMKQRGFHAYSLERWRRGFRRGVSLRPMPAPSGQYQYEVVFARALPPAFT